MIVLIESTLPTFKPVKFHTGLNVLLADTHAEATNRQTRNSAGKTSLIEIVHFLLGANCEKDSLFRTNAVIAYAFRGTFEIGGDRFVVERGGMEPAKIFVLDDGIHFDLPLKTDRHSGRMYVSNTNWRMYLGHAMFGMPANITGTIFEDTSAPTFRSLFSYFARRWRSNAFSHPERHAEQQQRGDWQVALSYLFGLDWRIPAEFQKVRERERTLEELKRAARGGAFGNVLGTVAELRPQVTIAETRAARLSGQLADFQVLDSYRDLSRRAAKLKAEMQALGRENVALNDTLEHLQRSIEGERPPERADLQKLYQASRIELPDIALRRLEEVEKFYDSVIANRRSHLAREIDTTRRKIGQSETRLAVLDKERADILKTLEGRGALEDFVGLQRELATQEASAATLRERYKAAEVLEGESTQLEIDRVNLKRRLQEDHQQRKPQLDKAIVLIAEAISELYDDRTGRLIVDATENGPEFRISIEGDRGGGISKVEIFCFDVTLFQIIRENFWGPGFLIHDSHLFDGVDARQIAGALLIGARAASGNQQYIVTLNSDIFDALPLSPEIDRDAVVLPTRLSDRDETGGLFGFRFD